MHLGSISSSIHISLNNKTSFVYTFLYISFQVTALILRYSAEID